jgi:hypothetical protein
MVTLTDLKKLKGAQVGLTYLEKGTGTGRKPSDQYDIRMAVFGVLEGIKGREMTLTSGAVELSTNTPGSFVSANFIHDESSTFVIPRNGKVYSSKTEFIEGARKLFSRKGYYDKAQTGKWEGFLRDLDKLKS